jgi:methionyl-tRNA formyltransferase
MKIAFAGSPESAVPVLKHLATRHDVVCVLTKPDAEVGRKRVVTASAVAQAAAQLGIKTIKSDRPTPSDIEVLRSLGADVCIVVAYGAILKPEVLKIGLPFWNVHFSLLPQYRGATPVQAAILDGAKITGVSVFQIDSGLDTGPIIAQQSLRLEGNETSRELLDKLTSISLEVLDQVLAGPFPPDTKEQIGSVSHSGKATRADAKLSATMTARQVNAMVRAHGDSPGAWLKTNIGDVRVIRGVLGSGHELENNSSGIYRVDKSVLWRLANGETYELKIVQPQGKNQMPAIDWWRGLREEIVIV